MLGDLLPRGTIPVAQFSTYELSGLRNKRQDGLKTFLALVLRIVTPPCSHLLPVDRVHGRIRVESHRLQFDIGRFPYSLPHLSLYFDELLRHRQMQRGQETPECALRWQLRSDDIVLHLAISLIILVCRISVFQFAGCPAWGAA